LVVLIAAGCASGPAPLEEVARPGESDLDAPTTARVDADWDDLDAAVRVAATRCELAATGFRLEWIDVERTDRFSDRPYADRESIRANWSVLGRDGRTGVLTAERSRAAAAAGENRTEITLTCRIGALGVPGDEACLVGEVAERLAALRGSVASPLAD
jgi:hypothetical protein